METSEGKKPNIFVTYMVERNGKTHNLERYIPSETGVGAYKRMYSS